MLSVLVFRLKQSQQQWAGRMLALLLLAGAVFCANGQFGTVAGQARAEFWQEVNTGATGRRYQLDKAGLAARLQQAPREFTVEARQRAVVVTLPLPDGGYEQFRLEESPVLDAALAARFPQIKSYRGQGLGRAAMTMRCDWSPRGLHAIILSGQQTIYITPENADGTLYRSALGETLQDTQFECLVADIHKIQPGAPGGNDATNQRNRMFLPVGSTLRTYRIAIAATWEYCNTYGGGTNEGTVTSLNTWLNAANVIYEREFAVHLNLVNDIDVLYTTERGFTATTDPYNNSSASALLNQVFTDLSNNVGEANYDLGHVFGQSGGTGGSGVAYIGVVCDNNTYGFLPGAAKSGGATRVGGTVANSTALGVWVHELGHQFGSNHNFNGTLSNCASPNRNAATAYESGSGSTIMAYSSICGADNVTTTRDLRFHSRSFEQITNYIISSTGATCGTTTATGNNIPTVNAGPDYTIPKNTPFTLTAGGSDADAGDVPNLTYVWEQIDSGGTNYFQNGTSASYNDAADPATTTRPIFRAFPVTTSPARTFPSLTYILNNANDPPDTVGGLQTAEELPRIGRTLNFRATIRDNRSGFGGVSDDSVVLTVDGASGPFRVTMPNSAGTWTGSTLQTVTWDVANTTAAPVNCANVRVSLSTDGGNTFPHILAASTPNDGSEVIALPNGFSTTTARIKVEAVGNIFFDIGDANFTLTPGDPCLTISGISPTSGLVGSNVVITGANFTDVTGVRFFNNVTASFTINSSTQITATVPAGATTGPITLSETGCPDKQTATFTIAACPTVSGIAPGSGLPGSTVTITGANFTGVTAVRFFNNVNASFTVVSDTQINATVPAGATTGPLTISKTGCSDVATSSFTVIQCPTFSSLSTPNGVQGSSLTINGNNFVGVTSVVFSSGVNASLTVLSETQITTTVPAGAVSGPLTLNKPGCSGVATSSFTVCQTVSGLSPTAGLPGSITTISGSGFTGVTAVRFFNNVTASFTIVSDTQVNTTVPAGATPGSITISKTGCSDVATGSFTVIECPTFSSLSTPNGVQGSSLTINGNKFVGVTSVVFSGGVSASFTIVSETQITTTVPAGALSGPITINEPSCSGVTTSSFTVCPTITGLSPAYGTPGTVTTIIGSGFTGVTGVRFFNNVSAPIAVSDTRIDATVPAGAATGPLTVSKPGCADVVSVTFTLLTSLGAVTLADAASYNSTEVAVESVVAAFGSRLATTSASATTAPLPTVLAGTGVTVRDSASVSRAAGIYFVAPDQLNFLLPAGTASGTATVTVFNAQGYLTGTIAVATVAPRLFSADSSGAGLMKGYAIRTVGAMQTIEQVARFDQPTLQWVAVPVAQPPNQVVLVLLGTGFRNRSSPAAVSVTVGGTPATVVSASASSATIGFDELRVQLPALTSGSKNIVVTVDSKPANVVTVQIQ